MSTRGPTLGSFVAVLVALAVFASCASWQTAARTEQWTLYAERALTSEETRQYVQSIEPARAAVADALGPFESRVSLYVWEDGDAGPVARSSSAQLNEGGTGAVQEVPGIGPARVRAFHARTKTFFGPSSGIYLGAPETGTAAHELVHARIAEENLNLPLWLEEGLANVLGDGYQEGERWVVDGLSCWPLRELTEARITDAEFVRLLALSAEDSSDVRENVLAHFVGWAIVFDLYRESGKLDWRAWVERYGRGIDPSEARMRMQRTLTPAALESWLERLKDAQPAVRVATAKGLWKLRSLIAVEALLDAIEREKDPLARVAFAINLLASAGEMRLPENLQRRMWRQAWPTLRRAELDDPREQKAIEELFATFRWGSRSNPRAPLEALRRFWAE
ncbi:MAG: hypothetical protein IPJ77_23605 [Planctomycetes bacterium]|nr:hypothetical protein [Planctomycetota bacterium]